MASSAPSGTSVPIRETPSNLLEIAESITMLKPPSNSMRGKGEQVFACSDVQVYFIQPQQNVATRRTATTLKVVTIPMAEQDLSSDNMIPPAFIEAGGWLYPLIPNKSPVYRTSEKYYVFPDLLSKSPGASVGLVFPSSISAEQRDTFEIMLLNLAGLESFPSSSPEHFGNPGALISSATTTLISAHGPPPVEPLSSPSPALASKIAVGLMAAAEVASIGLSMGATKTAQLIDYGTGYVKAQLPPVGIPVEIDPQIKETVETVKKYTGKAVELSSIAVSKLAEASSKLAAFAAYYFQSTASSVIVNYGGQSPSDTADFFDGMFEVTEGAVNGIGMVYNGLYHAGKILSTSLTYNTIDVIEYCYGAEAGQIVEVAAETVGNVASIGLKAGDVNPTRVVGRAVKDTARQILIKAPEPPEINFNNYNPF